MKCQVSSNNDSLSCQFEQHPIVGMSYSGRYKANGKDWCLFHLPRESSEKVDMHEPRGNAQNFNVRISEFVLHELKSGKDEVDLSYAVFPKGFSMNVLSTDYRNKVSLNLSYCKFMGEVNLQGKSEKIPSEIRWCNAEFFSEVIFFNLVRYNCFDNVTFHDTVSFRSVGFFAVTFIDAEFKEDAFFEGANFEKAIFDNAKFYGDTFFKEANFSGGVSFNGAKFFKLADFSITASQDPLRDWGTFNEIVFGTASFGKSDFQNRRFTLKTDFSKCIFEKAPLFHGCKFHQYMIFPPQKSFKDTKSEYAAGAYRTLSIAMAGLKARKYEAIFYALEQKSLRSQLKFLKNPMEKSFSCIYWWTTDYGQSIGRAFLAFLVTVVSFSILYALIASPFPSIHSTIDWRMLSNAGEFTMQQIVKPFEVWMRSGNDCGKMFSSFEGRWWIVRLIATFQSVLSLALITMFVFVVRWRFKRE